LRFECLLFTAAVARAPAVSDSIQPEAVTSLGDEAMTIEERLRPDALKTMNQIRQSQRPQMSRWLRCLPL
jgi:hypothetical protein